MSINMVDENISEINTAEEPMTHEINMAEVSEGGESFISAFFQPLVEKISSLAVSDFFPNLKLDKKWLNNLKSDLLSLDAILNDAESKAYENTQVKLWLDRLNEVRYDLEDLLDDISNEGLHRQLEGKPRNIKTRFQEIISTKFKSPRKDIKQRQKAVAAQIKHLRSQKDKLGLSEASLNIRVPSRVSAGKKCFEDVSQIFGRDEDKEALLKLLLSDGASADDRQTHVITMVGESGVGKTTLAQLVYNDPRAKEHFNFKAWIHVSEDFDDLLLTKAIFHAFTQWPSDIEDLGILQTNLQERVSRKKFLLVLDNLSMRSDWRNLQKALTAGANGSKIIVTTCHPELQETMGTLPAFTVRCLTNEESWELFAKHAFPDKISSLHPELEAIRKEIVEKCRGLPLVAKLLGSLLCFKPVEGWHAVLENNILEWDEDPIASVLKVSYNDLPIHLKLCVAYCSIFPMYHEYEEEKLVKLWMAEGFLQQKNGIRMEEVGSEYFCNLTYRSIFQPSGAYKSFYIMHDRLKDLALSESGYLCCRLMENNKYSEVSRKTRHLIISGGKNIAERCKAIFTAKFLRTLILYNLPCENKCHLSGELLNDLFETLQRLRVLSLSRYDITELPDSMGKLKHLRSLDLSHTSITWLPDSVSSLYNLQTLLLSDCYRLTELPDSIHKLERLQFLDVSCSAITILPDSLSTLYNLLTLLLSYCRSVTKLPENMGDLINLRHLDIRGLVLKEMPADMGRLTELQNLSNFIVGDDIGLKITELGSLSNLRGSLQISQLQNVVSGKDAYEAKLKNKKDLEGLVLSWSNETGDSQNETIVLEQLEPNKNLKYLSIISYSGTRFPDWLGDSSFSKMVHLRLSNCNSGSHLPPLGQLPSLKALLIERMNKVKRVGPEFYGLNSSLAKPFPSLNTLVFWEMLKWEEWIFPDVSGELFSQLKLIRISRCPKLAKCSYLPPSAKIEISKCPLLRVSVTDDLRLNNDNTIQLGSDDELAGRPPVNPVMKDLQLLYSRLVQLKIKKEIALQPLERRTDVPSISHNFPPKLALPKLPGTVEKKLHEGDKFQFRRKKKLFNRPSTSRLPEVEELQVPDSNVVQRTDVSISNSPFHEPPKPLTGDSSAKHAGGLDNPLAATEISSDNSIDDPINIWYDEEDLEDISSPEQESLNVSQILQLKRLPPKLYSLKIEGCDALNSLPEELMHSNPYLRHLYIIDCHFLKSIHGSHLPNALKTLYIRKCKKLEFLFPEETMGKHASLEHLCIGSSCDSLKSFPLAFFPKLKNISIWDCSNFNSISNLEDHTSLDALEIRDCAKLETFSERGLCTPNLTSILLSNCKILKLLPGQLHSLTSLQSLIVNECPKLDSLPEGGLPSSLNFVCISSCCRLTPCIEWGLHTLSTFSRIEIEGGCTDLDSFPEQNLLPRNLNSLRISRLPNLKVLDYKGLQHLTSLETLKINSCNKLQSIPEEGLPSSLTYLYITDCPLLKSKLENRRGKEWYKIAHIPHIQIDMEVIS